MFKSTRSSGTLAGAFMALVAAATLTCGSEVVGPVVGQNTSEPQVAVQAITYVDDGELCLYANASPDMPFGPGGPQVFAEGDQLVVRVRAPDCLSSTCDIDREAGCTIEGTGTHLVVRSDLAFHRMVEANACSFDCGTLYAECRSAPLDKGVYEVQLGDRLVTLPVPSTMDTACVPEDECATDADCDHGYCGLGTNDRQVCKSYAMQGERCQGFMPTEQIRDCAPGLVCVQAPGDELDMPGVCWPTCETDDDCPGGFCLRDGQEVPLCMMSPI